MACALEISEKGLKKNDFWVLKNGKI